MDWKKMIETITESGMSQTAIGRHVGMSTSWVRGILIGKIKTVSWEAGEALRKLDRKVKRGQK